MQQPPDPFPQYPQQQWQQQHTSWGSSPPWQPSEAPPPQYPQQMPPPQWQQPPMPPQQWNPQQSSFPPQQWQQQQWYQQPPNEPRRKWYQRLFAWCRHHPIATAAIIVALLAFGAVANLTKAPEPSATSPTTQPTQATQQVQATQQPTLQPTSKRTAKPTVQPTTVFAATYGTPHLGGPISDFFGAYGQPINYNNPGGYAGQYFLQRDTDTRDVTAGLIASTSVDSKTAVDNIIMQAVAQNATYHDPQAGSSFSPSDAKARCLTFAPSDAHFVKEFVYADNSGFDMVYTSASLAENFPPGDFTDSQGNQVQAGMFDVSFLYKSIGDTQHIDSCRMIIGEQQTTG